MSKVKTRIEAEKVIVFLKSHFDEEISMFTFIKGGESSQAFSFDVGGESFVIRVNRDLLAFEKDRYSFVNFHSEFIPIPEVIKIGVFDEKYYYAISKKVEGKMLNELSDVEYEEIFPELMSILDVVHSVDISKTSGFGKWEADGAVEAQTWKEYVLAVKNYVLATENTPSLFETSFLEKDLWEEIYERVKGLLIYCPEERYLIHGDYGSDNVIADKGKITGVIDWAGAKYGDFLYDVAWLNFWNPQKNPMNFFKNYYKSKELSENFSERVMCYQLRIGLSSLSFFAYSDQEEKYQKAKEKLLAIMKG